jgi:homoserine O-acetyltransferase
MEDRRDLWWPSPTTDLARAVRLEMDDGFETVHGATLDEIQVSYESWGELAPERDNVVLLVHPLTLDCHATGGFADQAVGWWEPLIGPGRTIDTDRYHVVCPNLLGGCYGTTGPRFPAADGEPHLDRFPLVTPLDMMRVQRIFLRQLGIERPRMVIGPSMGGMIAWEWAIEAGENVETVVVVAAPLRTTAYQIGLNWLQRRGIEMDLSEDRTVAQWGQMVARGVAMLSYRAPIGLEEKFGRDWFKKPGNDLRKRGRYNIESWLRHHGKRIVRRFDPYTYIAYTRAMDLHDVGEGRGGLITALDRVRCKVLVVGISSDQLYPASEVNLGAHMLSHLGKRVAYAEIRSPHGHDSWLLETEQLASFLRETPLRAPSVVPTPSQKGLRTVRLGILGAGQVAALFLRLLDERRDQIRDDFDLRFEVGAVAEIDPRKKLDPVFGQVEVLYEPESLIERDDLDAFLDLTRGTGSHALVERALSRRRPVATPNKSLIREYGSQLERTALDHGVRLAYHNAIAAGWPLLYSVERPLGQEQVHSIRAVLSSTCNLILERMEQGSSFGEALEDARRAKLTEPEPSLDTSGWDTAQKLTILVARALGVRYSVDDLAIRGIADLDPWLVREAVSLGLRVKLVGLFVRGDPAPVLGVLPLAVPEEGHLGGLRGDNNVVVLDGGESGEMVYLARGTGDLPVATAVLGDLIGLFVPARSWTGRFPSADRSPEAPRFTHFLSLDQEDLTVTDSPSPNSLPLLESLIHAR